MSIPCSTESNSLASVSFVEKVLLVCQTKDKANSIKRYRVVQQRLIIEDDDSTPHARSSGES